jgi:putative pyruvate formate lyase activating enzyme
MPRDPLQRYNRILEGEAKAKYLHAKNVSVIAKLGDDTSRLWEAHARAQKTARGGASVSLLDLKCELAMRMLEDCTLCERRCGVNRKAGRRGHCGVLESRISSEFLHMGEEPELVPSYTIFFSGCTFNCVFCQNWDISTCPDGGASVGAEAVARMIEAKVHARSKEIPHRTFRSYSRS